MRINKKLIAKSIIYAVIFIIFTVLETNILNGLKILRIFGIFGVKPNLVISLIIAAAVAENERYAAVLGMICGFVMDSSAGSPFFFSGIYYFIAAYIAGTVARYYFAKSLLTMIIMILPVCAVREVLNMFYLISVWSDFNIAEALYKYILPEFVFTVILAPAVYFLVKFTAGKISYQNV